MAGRRPRDNQYSKVLRAEDKFIKQAGVNSDWSEVSALASRVRRSSWLSKQNPDFRSLPDVTHTYNKTMCHQDHGPWAFQRLTTVDFLHELAHHLAPRDVQLHGPEFAKAWLECEILEWQNARILKRRGDKEAA